MTVQSWERLHRNERHQLKYPSEHVVRWLAGLPGTGVMALDIGCGAGRHTRLLRDFGYRAIGVDASSPYGVVGDMRDLPSADDWFDVVLAFGVFYYGTWADMQKAVDEMHRVLKPGGHGFVCVRTTDDWRARRGPRVETLTYQLELPGQDEDGMVMNFLTESRIEPVYAAFTEISWEKTETTVGRSKPSKFKNSDWLIRLVK